MANGYVLGVVFVFFLYQKKSYNFTKREGAILCRLTSWLLLPNLQLP